MFLSLVHLTQLRCEECGEALAEPGARSFIVRADGDPVRFSPDDPPAEMVVHVLCPSGHTNELNVPNEISAEESLNTPEGAPIGADACLISGTTESGKAL
ncbi:MAG TPA: hypothetical protein VJP85_07455 [Candidatus Baltobacteraceae bacterium]|nr:hypothetical protein [Candidatus Baltobacteraceae bacterium]